ncbi:MAG: metallophosphoesterase family protein [Fusobacteriota bacterium]
MKIAFLSDIHSNLYALKSVLRDIKKNKVNEIYSLGDIIGYHSYPNEVIEILRDENILSIMGNHDFDIINESYKKDIKDIKYWTYKELKKENLEYLKRLPKNMILKKKNIKIKLVHGSSESITEYLFEDSQSLEREFKNMTEDILISGHTHFPYIKKINGKTAVNTGSVGKPKIGKPTPSYVILEINDDSYNAKINFVEYDFKKAMEDMSKKGLSKKHTKELELGKVIK